MPITNPEIQHRIQRIERSLDQVGSLLVPVEINDGVKKAITLSTIDPDMALGRARKVLDFIISDLYKREFGRTPGTQPLENLVQQLAKTGKVPRTMVAYANSVREFGNVGIHASGEAITQEDVVSSLENLMRLVAWYCEQVRPTGEEKSRAETKQKSQENRDWQAMNDAVAPGLMDAVVAPPSPQAAPQPSSAVPGLPRAVLPSQKPSPPSIVKWIGAVAFVLCVAAGAGLWFLRHNQGSSASHQVFLKHKYDGIALMRSGDADGAIKDLRSALSMEPNDSYTHYSLAEALAQQGDLKGAITEYRESLRIRPHESYAEIGLANALFRAGNLDESIAEYRVITTANYSFPLDPSASAEVHNNYGLALLLKGDAGDAAAQFRLAMNAKPGWQEPEDNLKKALRSQASY